MYTISIQELIKRPLIRDNYGEEWMNKMTDEELKQFDKDVWDILEENGVPKVFPDWNAALLAKHIDRCILYELFKMSPHQRKFKRVYKLRGVKFKKKHGK